MNTITSGFYKYENEELFFAANYVVGPTINIEVEKHADYTYPVEGWSYFDTEEEAKLFFDIKEKEPEDRNSPLPE